MRSELAQWTASADEPIRAQDWNGWLESLEKLMPTTGKVGRSAAAADYPFQVAIAKWDNATAVPANRLWRVDVTFGCCNDQPASILYARRGDARQWSAPAGVWITPGLPVPADSTAKLDFVYRSLLEDDPPWLLVTTPEAASASEQASDDFRLWVGSRPSYFQQEEFVGKKLWYTSVFLSANPLHALPEVSGSALTELASKLPERFRLRAGRAPTGTVGIAGGTIEIARLWLVRDPAVADVLGADQIYTQQRVYTHLQAVIVAPGLSISDGSLLGDLAQDQLNEALAAAAGQEFWTG
jgi:hypothetical protein